MDHNGHGGGVDRGGGGGGGGRELRLPRPPGKGRIFLDVALHAVKKGFAHDANWKEVLLAVVATVIVAIVAMILAGTTNWFIKQIQ